MGFGLRTPDLDPASSVAMVFTDGRCLPPRRSAGIVWILINLSETQIRAVGLLNPIRPKPNP